MRPQAIAFLFAIVPHPASPTIDRDAYVSQLLIDTLKSHIEQGLSVVGLEMVRKGAVLYIRDDSDGAKAFYDAMSHDPGVRLELLRAGFKVVVLVNKPHGTFVLSLLDNDLEKAEPVDA